MPDTMFIKTRGKYNVYSFTCPGCGAEGECGVPKGSSRLFNHGCGTLFIQRCPTGLHAKPRLVVVTKKA
jgi:hypothetical protein